MAASALSGAPHPLGPDVVLAPGERVEPSLPLASDGVQRWIWHGRYGAMLIEVIGEDIFVNTQRVEPHAA